MSLFTGYKGHGEHHGGGEGDDGEGEGGEGDSGEGAGDGDGGFVAHQLFQKEIDDQSGQLLGSTQWGCQFPRWSPR